jgi:hypothetical protein
VNDAKVVVHALGSEAGRRQRGGRELEGPIIRNVELPIGTHVGRSARLQVSIGDGEQVGDFLAAGLVFLEPPEGLPIR